MTELTRLESRLYVVALLAAIYTATWRVVVASAPAPVERTPAVIAPTPAAIRPQPRTELRRQPVRRARTRSS